MEEGLMFEGQASPGEWYVDQFVDMVERIAADAGLSIGGSCRASGRFKYFLCRPGEGVAASDRTHFLKLHKHPLVKSFTIERHAIG